MNIENTEPRRYAEDVDLDAQFPGESLRAPEPEYDAPEPVADESVDPEFLEWKRQREEAAKRPTIPANAPRPQDHKPKASEEPEDDYPTPVMDEATGILVVTIHHDGLELTIPADPEDWPIQATLAFEDGKILNAIRALLSPREFNKVLAKKYRNKDFGKLYERLAVAGGFDTAGN
jgi:hypothetical protein